MSKVFVGGLAWATNETSLKEAFTKFGTVTDTKVIMDRDTGRSKGFGFVTFDSPSSAKSAIEAMNGQELDGRPVTVNEAKERPKTSGGRW